MKRECRACKHFVRLKNADEDKYYTIQKQGFCLMGKMEGDFSLYISSSISRDDCTCYVFDTYNNEIYSMEKALYDQLRDFQYKCEDKRTKEYKMIKPLIEAQSEVKNNFFGKWTWDFFKIRKIAAQVFQRNHDKLYKEINDKILWNKKEYMEFLAELTFNLHEKFCDCDDIRLVK